VTFWGTVRQAILGRFDRWDPDADETLRYLKTQRAFANHQAQRLREYTAWEDLFYGKERR
jgi:hypothetical protein